MKKGDFLKPGYVENFFEREIKNFRFCLGGMTLEDTIMQQTILHQNSEGEFLYAKSQLLYENQFIQTTDFPVPM